MPVLGLLRQQGVNILVFAIFGSILKLNIEKNSVKKKNIFFFIDSKTGGFGFFYIFIGFFNIFWVLNCFLGYQMAVF